MAQIIGFRKDRLGARIIALGNLLYMEDKFGAAVEYLWPDAFEVHDMAIENADHPIFEPAFQKKYIQQIPANIRPDIDDLTDIDKIRGRIGSPIFANRLAQNERFLCNEGLEPLLFSNEQGPAYGDAFRASLARITFAEPIRTALNTAVTRLRDMGETPLALHVRRGDVLDVAPWMHKNWVAKFAPDEFYEAVMQRPDVSALLFSDTPAAARKLASAYDNAITLDDLLDTPHLSEMQRDLVELLLMAQCEEVVAPSLSAFSSSAALMKGMSLRELPGGLSFQERVSAYDHLLERTLQGPDSFHNTGDFAQSIGYAFRHALMEKRHYDMYGLLKSALEEGQDFAFYKPLTMALAIACGAPDHAIQLNAQAHKDNNIWSDDLMICDALGCVASHTVGDTQKATSRFLRLYLARKKSVPQLDSLANYFFTQEPTFQSLFMVDDLTLQTFRFGREREWVFLFPIDDTILDGTLNEAFPLWIPGADWPEMFEKDQITKNITKDPPFQAKRGSVPDDIKAAEIAFFQSEAALPSDPRSLSLLSTLSVALMLSGRYRRASGLMFHCRKHDPDNPLFLKRLANRFLATRQYDKAHHNLTRALEAAPGHVGLVLSMAQLHQEQDNHEAVTSLLETCADKEFLPLNYFKTWEKSLRKLKSREATRVVISLASTRYPGHEIFEKQWAGKLS